MPVMNGLDYLKAVRDDPTIPRPPVILLTAVAAMLYTSVAVAGPSSIQIAASAVVPLGIALGLIEVARRYRRGDA